MSRVVQPPAVGARTTDAGILLHRRTVRIGAVLLAVAGLSMAAGGALHPHGEGATVDEALGSMLGSPLWDLAHVLVLAGLVVGIAGLILIRRSDALGPRLRPWLTVTIVTWTLGAVETVPHLLAGGEHGAHAAGEPTPMTDAHVMLSTVTTPLLALATAILAVQVARRSRSVAAWVLAGLAIVGGLAFGAASPLLAITGNPAVSALFPGQMLIDVWLVGTAIRLLWSVRLSADRPVS